jgi:hypothetical protein
MPKHLLRPLLIVEFLIALEVVYTTWSEVGGQYHLDLMFWPWKLGVGLAAAWLITAITGNIVRNDGAINRRVIVYASLLCLVAATAGAVTWYYHMHEPTDQQDDDEDDDSVRPAADNDGLPGSTGFAVADHRQAFLTAEGCLEFRHI